MPILFAGIWSVKMPWMCQNIIKICLLRTFLLFTFHVHFVCGNFSRIICTFNFFRLPNSQEGASGIQNKNLLGVTSHNFLFILSRNYWEYKKWLSEIKAKINDNLTSERGRRRCRALLRLCSVVGNTNRFETEKKKSSYLTFYVCF